MIGTVCGRVGELVRLSGYADDFDQAIAAVEFSLNDGETWTEYVTSGADSERLLRWQFSFVPEIEGSYDMLVRSRNALGQSSPSPARVHIEVSAN